MKSLGNLELEIKPAKKGQVIAIVIAVIGLVSIFFAEWFWRDYDLFGIPAKYVVGVLCIVLIILSAVQLVRGKKPSSIIQIYNDGISVEDFSAHYKDLSVREISGAANTKLEFSTDEKTYIYNHDISKEDFGRIREKITAARKKAEAELEAKVEPEEQEFEEDKTEE